jgi:hypothetical protein
MLFSIRRPLLSGPPAPLPDWKASGPEGRDYALEVVVSDNGYAGLLFCTE